MKKQLYPLVSAAVALALSASPGHADQQAVAAVASSAPGGADQSLAVSASLGNENPQLEEVTVTGTRLGHNLTSYTPISVVSSTQLAQMGTTNIESYLNDLPQISGGFNNTANFPGNGTASVDLRGFGAKRTLVLVDGRRFVPTNEDGTVDITAIPAALVKRVEVVTGGESAVYGSDAITGVVNFILKDDFEGFQVNANDRVTTNYHDGNTQSFDLLAGGHSADERGHVMVYANYTVQDPILEGARPYTDVVLNDGTLNGHPALVHGGSSGVPQTQIAVPAAVIPKTLPGYSESTLPVKAITFDSSGNPLAFANPQDLYNYGPPSYMQIPYNRFEAHFASDYKILPSVDAYADLTYLRNESDTNGAPAPLFIATSNQVYFDYADNPYLSPQAKSILAAGEQITDPQVHYPVGDGKVLIESLGTRLPNSLPRIQYYTRDTYQITTGFKGELFHTGWTYDTYFQQGIATTTEQNDNNINANKFYQALNATTGANGQPVCINQTGGCAPINIWGEGNISQAALSYVLVGYDTISRYSFENAALNINGNIPEAFSLRAGPITTAVGVEWRKEKFQSQPDSGQLINGVPVLPTYGTYNVAEYYGEINVPVLKDSILAKSFNVRGAIRESQYNTAGKTTTFSFGGEWTPPVVDWIKFRGGKQRAIRAPNVAELFAPLQGAGLTTFTDPCDARSGFLRTPAQQAFCNTWGAPTGFQEANVSVSAIQESNPNLKPETSDSWTAGVVITPPIFRGFLNGFDVTVDYYNIALKNAIAPFGGGVGNDIDSCFFSENLSSPFCQSVQRDPLGNILPITSILTNVSLKATAGLDAEMALNFDMAKINGHLPGILSIGYASNYEFKNGFQPTNVFPFIECAGEFGPPCGGTITGSGQPKWRNNTTVTWTNGGLSVTARWRWIKGMEDARFAQAEALGLSTQSLRNTIPVAGQTTPNVNYLDASASWQINRMFLVSLGFTNLLNKTPPLYGNQQVQDNTDPDTYDPTGRWVWANIKVNF